MGLLVHESGVLWSHRDPPTWQMRLVDLLIRFIGWLTGQVVELSARAAAPYPRTELEELDVLEALHQQLLRAQDVAEEQIRVTLTVVSIRPGVGSRITAPLGDIILPKNVTVPKGFPKSGTVGVEVEKNDHIPARKDPSPRGITRYDYRHCPVTVRAWAEIKKYMPPDGATIIAAYDAKQEPFILGRYMIFRGRLEHHPNYLSVNIRSK